MNATMNALEIHLNEAEHKALDSLARYKFQMFGYWAAIWVHLNRIGGFKRKNPFASFVRSAKQIQEHNESPQVDQEPEDPFDVEHDPDEEARNDYTMQAEDEILRRNGIL